MNSLSKSTLLTLVIGSACAASAQAAILHETEAANATAHCQAFTPGISNTIRNRVVGTENVGSAPIAVACDFEKTYGIETSPVQVVTLRFSNNNASGTITMNCTLLTGFQGGAGAVVLNKMVVVSPGVQSQISYSAADTPNPGDVNLGSELVGVNCTVPHGGVINDTYIEWDRTV